MKAAYILCLILAITICVPVFSADGPPMPAPGAHSPGGGAHALIIGPADATGSPRSVTGQLVLLANVPRTISASEVEIFVDEVSVGTSNTKPYKVEYDCSKISNGLHVAKAVARDNSGTQLWSASAKIEVAGENSSTQNALSAISPPPAPVFVPAKIDATASNELSPKVTYTSQKYGFSITHPQGWVVKDETASMKSKTKDEFWLVMGEPPIVVNIHCKELAPETDAEVFAKFNPYVQSWERRAVADSPAFVTTDGKPELKRVVHRMIFIKGGVAWMANCIDTTGGQPEKTANLLESMLESLRLTKPVIHILPVK